MNAEAARAWLEARYGEDQRDAEYVHTPGWWTAASRVGEPNLVEAYVVADDGSDDPAEVTPDLIWRGDAVHIARWSPARVLVEVAAKRRRLERHRPGSVVVVDGDETWVRCIGHEWVAWPCPDVIDDAQAYTDRPDFPDELRLP